MPLFLGDPHHAVEEPVDGHRPDRQCRARRGDRNSRKLQGRGYPRLPPEAQVQPADDADRGRAEKRHCPGQYAVEVSFPFYRSPLSHQTWIIRHQDQGGDNLSGRIEGEKHPPRRPIQASGGGEQADSKHRKEKQELQEIAEYSAVFHNIFKSSFRWRNSPFTSGPLSLTFFPSHEFCLSIILPSRHEVTSMLSVFLAPSCLGGKLFCQPQRHQAI